MPAKKMVNLSVEETSGVDHPAHLVEGWVIVKAADRNGVTAAITALAKEASTEEEHVNDDKIEAAETAETEVAVDESAAELAKAQERIVELEAALAAAAAAPAEDPTSEEAILKAAPAPVREMLEKARVEAEAAREELRKEKEAQRDREFVEKAKGWAHLSISAEEFGPMLRRLFDADTALGETIEKALSAANAQAESGAIFDELGKSAPVIEGADAYGKVQSLAKAAVEKGEYATVEQAVAGLIQSNPDLYTDYLAERRG